MSRYDFNDEDLKEMRGTVVLLQGVFKDSFFKRFNKKDHSKIFIMEGRPNLEAAKKNSSKLLKKGIRPTIIADNMAGFLFEKQLVKEVWVSYQVADKAGAVCHIGALILAVLGKNHQIPVRCFPSDLKRPMLGLANDVLSFHGKRIAPQGIRAYVPLLEWISRSFFAEIVSD